MDEIRLIANTHEMACNLSKQNFNIYQEVLVTQIQWRKTSVTAGKLIQTVFL